MQLLVMQAQKINKQVNKFVLKVYFLNDNRRFSSPLRENKAINPDEQNTGSG